MTGFAAREGAAAGWRWSWELRSVNGRGLDIRLRLPDWPADLERPVRALLQSAAGRGNVTLSLKLGREEGDAALALNAAALERVLDVVAEVEARALDRDLGLAPTRAADILALRGVLDASGAAEDPAELRAALLADAEPLIAEFREMRGAEGASLDAVLRGQVDAIEAGIAAARALLDTRAEAAAQAFRDALGRIAGADVDEARVAQEIAVLAVKSDISEELDRLDAHVAAARDLLDGAGPKGRKLDFLTQEFNREANTLCSKAGHAELTRVGLDLKHTIDQMREQVQNVE
jgi:uncharacterized protein (TIGR00255 family)